MNNLIITFLAFFFTVVNSTECHINMNVGHRNYCSVSCPCEINMGDCDNDDECTGSLKCVHNIGKRINKRWSSKTDVCQQSSWECIGRAKSRTKGSYNFCTSTCKCRHGKGDCDMDSQCIDGTTCVYNVGKNYGYWSVTDVCLSNTPTESPTDSPTDSPNL